MTPFTLLILSSALFLHAAASPPPPAAHPDAARLDKYRFKASLAVAVFFLSLLSLLLWFLLLYVRYFRGQRQSASPDPSSPEILRLRSQFLGLDRSIIDSLPLVEYSSLKGAKDRALECPVCLSRFEEVEVLRLLPRCNHAFHVRCIDRWLEKNSSCPICRNGVSREDAVVECSNRWVFWNPLADYGEQEAQRDEDVDRIRRTSRPNLNHKIITLPKIAFENRWSDASSSDLLFLKSEMIDAVSSNRFSLTANFYTSETGIEDVLSSSSEGRRSVSEITTVSRFRDMGLGKKRYNRECSSWGTISNEEERRRRVWLQIVRRTVVWIANRERSQVHDDISSRKKFIEFVV